MLVVNYQNAVNFVGDLHLSTPYIAWFQGEPKIDLDGEFTAAELRAVADYMEASSEC